MGKNIIIDDKTNILYLALLMMWRILREVHYDCEIYRCFFGVICLYFDKTSGIFDGDLAWPNPQVSAWPNCDPRMNCYVGTWLLVK